MESWAELVAFWWSLLSLLLLLLLCHDFTWAIMTTSASSSFYKTTWLVCRHDRWINHFFSLLQAKNECHLDCCHQSVGNVIFEGKLNRHLEDKLCTWIFWPDFGRVIRKILANNSRDMSQEQSNWIYNVKPIAEHSVNTKKCSSVRHIIWCLVRRVPKRKQHSSHLKKQTNGFRSS